MAEAGLRDLGAFIPGARRAPREPEAPPLPVAPEPPPVEAAKPAVIVTPPPPKRGALFGDLPTGEDALGIDPTLAHLAEVALHRNTATPLSIGLIGPSGSGKSFALARLSARIEALAAAAARTKGPFVDKVHVQPIDAASLDDDIASGLASRLYAGLRQTYPALAREVAQAARDPHVVLRETNDKLDEARRRLDSERRALDDAGSRRARLTETVLYEAAGSQVDAYARANRSGIESRLVSFGINGDPIRNYKDLVQLVAGSGGKVGLALRSLWGFKGQLKLILAAVAAIVVGIGLGIAIDDQAVWLGDLRTNAQAGTPVANWFQTHMGLLATARGIAFGLAAVAILANLWRAFSFLQPIFKGVRLLDYDLDNRRRDLDGLYAHQTKRVDALDKDVERLTREVSDAERRAGGATTSGEPSPFEAVNASTQSQNFFSVLSRLMSDHAGLGPQRIVVALDNANAVSAERGRAILDTVNRLSGDGIVALIASDLQRLNLNGESASDFVRWVQIPVRLDAVPDERARSTLVGLALGEPTAASPAPQSLDASQSAFDAPVSKEETELLMAVAPVAGSSPRAVKRFVNLYSLARLDNEVPRGALALMLAVALGGNEGDKRTLASALSNRDTSEGADGHPVNAALRSAISAARAFDGGISTLGAAAAARRAALFSV